MNIFTISYLQNFSNIFSKTHQITLFFKIFSGKHACPRTPLANAWRRAMQIPPLFQKYFEPPPPEMKS